MPSIRIYDANLFDYIEEHPSFDYEAVLKFFIKMIQEQETTPNDVILDGIDRRLERNLKDINSHSQEQFTRFLDEQKNKVTVVDFEPIHSYFGVFRENFNSLKDSIHSKPLENNTFLLESINSLRDTVLAKPNENNTLDVERWAVLSDNFNHIRGHLGRLDENVKVGNEKIELMKDMNSKQKENSTIKGSTAEQDYLPLLQERLDKYEVKRTTEYHCMDFSIIDHTGFVVGLELKNYKYTVPKDQVDKFHSDMKSQGMSGILVSIDSNIVGCSSFDVKFKDGNIAIYISKNGYDMDFIEKAYQLICGLKKSFENQEKKGYSFTQDEITRISHALQSQGERTDSVISSLETNIDELKRIRKMDIIGLLTGINKAIFNVLKISKSKWQCSVCEIIFSSKTKCHNHICKNVE